MTVGQVAEELAKKGKAAGLRGTGLQVSSRRSPNQLGQEGLQVAGAATQGGEHRPEPVERGGDALMPGGTMGGGARQLSTPQAQSAAVSHDFRRQQRTADPEAAGTRRTRPSRGADLMVQSSTSTTSTAASEQSKAVVESTSIPQKTPNRP